MSSTNKTTSHIKALITDTEELLKETAGNAGDKIQVIRKKIEESLANAKDKFLEFEHEAVEKVKEGAQVADEFVHKNPWSSIGIAAGIAAGTGLIIGLALRKK